MADDNKAKFKSTLHLPVTDFPMRGNLPAKEPETLQRWEENKIYFKMLEKNKNKPHFYMPDGPPYANGDIHIGHALNKTLKDIVVKYKNMSGHHAPYIPGWDCHGLPIELNVAKALGDKKNETTPSEVRSLCRKEAQKWVELQREQFKRLGVLGDWDNPYLTMLPQYEAEEVRVLAKIFRNGLLYRGKKPVFWDVSLQTALAAAEVEYHDHKSLSVFVKFYVNVNEDLKKLGSPSGKTAFVVWTTTPWTLPANYATAVHPELTYGLFNTGDENIIVAKDLQESIEKTCGLNLKLMREFKGSDLEGLRTDHPFMNRHSPIVLADYVLCEATGVVHTAPGHGMDDYLTGLRYKLPIESPVTEDGHYTDEVPKYKGMNIWQANKEIAKDLTDSGHMLASETLVHSYPYNPRGKSPLIFRATDQWFIAMDDENFPLRKMALEACEEKIEFFPKWGKQRLESMMANAPDWCLSRQRTWGVPIPVFYCESCGEPLVKAEIMDAIADKMEASGAGIDAYHSTPTSEFVGDEACSSCGNKDFKHGRDILDVWFDSGVCHTAGPKLNDLMTNPANIYLEGSDQHRGWFQTSLLSSLAADRTVPFGALITHGFVLDAEGLKFSKSKGNAIAPADIIKNSGAEILRLWTAYEDYGQDVTIGEEMFKRITETYRRIRNTMRFLLGNLHGFDPSCDQVAFQEMPMLDRWALVKTNELTKKVTAAYEAYDFYKIYHALNNFFTVELSATYLDILKDRLYTWEKGGNPRRSSQTVFYHLLKRLTAMMAPVLSFTAEEVHGYIPGQDKESVFLCDFPTINDEWSESGLLEKLDLIFDVRDVSAKILEDMRKNKEIGSSLDAALKITAPEGHFLALEELRGTGEPDFLRELLIVSDVEITKGSALEIKAQKADGDKCQRCWHYSKNLATISGLPDVCPKCIEALK